jgi:hypothetical protein
LDLPISDNLRTAFKGGDPSAMERAVKEVIASELSAENDLRTEAVAGKEFGETPVEHAEAFIKGDVNQDHILELVTNLPSPDGVAEFFTKLKAEAFSNKQGEDAARDLTSRVVEMLQTVEANYHAPALENMMKEHPENWAEMLKQIFSADSTNATVIRNAAGVAEKLITEKKT